MYCREEIEKGLALYDQIRVLTRTAKLLGIGKRTLKKWILLREHNALPEVRVKKKPKYTSRRFSRELKQEMVRRCFIEGESIESVCKELGIRKCQLYNWYQKITNREVVEPMPKKKPEREAQKGISASSQDDMLKQMQEQMMRMQLEIDILNETLKS